MIVVKCMELLIRTAKPQREVFDRESHVPHTAVAAVAAAAAARPSSASSLQYSQHKGILWIRFCRLNRAISPIFDSLVRLSLSCHQCMGISMIMQAASCIWMGGGDAECQICTVTGHECSRSVSEGIMSSAFAIGRSTTTTTPFIFGHYCAFGAATLIPRTHPDNLQQSSVAFRWHHCGAHSHRITHEPHINQYPRKRWLA